MAKPSEQWSENYAHSGGKPDANLANDALHLGGIPAEDYATKKYVQEYHNAKELLLKDYIDAQDLAKLQEAKDYVDLMIRSQDFSNFAKLTDLQTLSQNLIERIQACGINCDNKIDSRIADVVSDTNANFIDVRNAITQLNANDQELFQSVSNGKKKVAAAITDKGVNTASNASFDTMASNIRKIQSGGEETDPNYVNTSDGTATEQDILVGKTAYGKGQKLYGQLVVPEYPTYGTDTTNATASADDLALGKSAYVNGQYLVGTANNPNVEEVYATSTTGTIKDGNIGLTKYPDSNETVTERTCIEFSKNGKYCVSVVKLSNSSYAIESHPVSDDGLIIHASKGSTSDDTVYKKYRYTYDELGIGSEEVVVRIRLGAAGYLGYSDRCLLIIQTRKKTGTYSYTYYYHLYTYHLNDNGVIGKEYQGERYPIENYVKSSSEDDSFIFANTNPYTFWRVSQSSDSSNNRFYLIAKSTVDITVQNESNVGINISFGSKARINMSVQSGYGLGSDFMDVSSDDKYICLWNKYGRDSYGGIILLDNNLYASAGISFSGLSNVYFPISNADQFLYAYETRNLKIYNRTSNSWTLNKSLTYSYPDGSNQYIMTGITSKDGNKIILVTSARSYGSYTDTKLMSDLRVAIIPIEDILSASDGDNIAISASQYFRLNFNNSSYTSSSTPVEVFSNSNGSKIYIFANSSTNNYNAQLWILDFDVTSNLVGVNYKGQFFRSTKSGLLTATANDVVNGKTFIGSSGTVETGTHTDSITEQEE